MSKAIHIPSGADGKARGKAYKSPYPPSASSSYNSPSPVSPTSPSSFEGQANAFLQREEPHTGKKTQKEERRVSLMSDTFAKQEHTVINVGRPDAPSLITCVRSGQGFEWNTEIFLPSYERRYSSSTRAELEHRKDPIVDIILTDEEIELFPQ